MISAHGRARQDCHKFQASLGQQQDKTLPQNKLKKKKKPTTKPQHIQSPYESNWLNIYPSQDPNGAICLYGQVLLGSSSSVILGVGFGVRSPGPAYTGLELHSASPSAYQG